MDTDQAIERLPVSRKNVELREEAMERILYAAMELLAEKGTSKLTLGVVGKRAGFSPSLPLYYFKTKANLIAVVAQNVGFQFQDKFAKKIKSRPGLNMVLNISRFYLEAAQTDSLYFRALQVIQAEAISSNSELLPGIQEYTRQRIKFIEAHLKDASVRGEISLDFDPTTLATIILSMLRGVLSLWLTNPKNVDLSLMAKTLTTLLERGLKPSEVV